VALLIAIGSAIAAVPALGDVTGITRHAQVRGGTLREFIQANRLTDVQASNEDEANRNAKLPLPTDVAEASKSFARYDANNGGKVLQQSQWDDVFRTLLFEKVPFALQDDYGTDVLKLADGLRRSKGKPLNDDRLGQLLEFHLDGFLANAQSQETARASRIANSISKLVLAGAAFLIFVLVLFCFIFVKIERNLRGRQPIEDLPQWTE
jgi:hypothetical protein